jgi:uncharacterized glyoxalase superfamily protein PhnB
MATQSTLSPALFYEDPAAAIEFLQTAFGFELTLRVTDDAGKIGHAQMDCGGAEVMLGPVGWSPWAKSPRQLGGATTQSVHLQVADVDAHHARAKAAGARIDMAPADQFYGDRTYRAIDPEGHVWTFSQTLRQMSDDEMSQGEWNVETLKR